MSNDLFGTDSQPQRFAKAAREAFAKVSRVSAAAEEFALHVRAYRLPDPERELRFAKAIGREWRFDFAWRAFMVAVEIEGLVVQRLAGELVVRGRHGSITGFKEDCVKYASAAMLGWTVLRFEQSQVKDATAIEYTQRVLAARGWHR